MGSRDTIATCIDNEPVGLANSTDTSEQIVRDCNIQQIGQTTEVGCHFSSQPVLSNVKLFQTSHVFDTAW
jgi:hypothetical protein